MFDTIEIIGDTMAVMNHDGEVLETAYMTTYRHAKSRICDWTHQYTIDVAEAYNKLAARFGGK